MIYDDPPRIDPRLEHENWRLLKIAFFDLETTNFPYIDLKGKGDSHFFDRITGEKYEVMPEFSILQFYGVLYSDGEIVDELELLVDPGFPIPPAATKINHITDEDVAGAPPIDEMLPLMFDFLIQADLTCAFSGRFDKNCLALECERLGLPVLDMPLMDVLPFERERKKKMSGNKLQDIAKRWGVSKMGKVAHGRASLHEAKTDVLTMVELVWALAHTLPWTFGQLLKRQWQIEKRHDKYYAEKNQAKGKK